ncbi:MAG: hypothetical protein GXO39_03545, partial [Thermotogae bacterium]|nr:hypothetical protein [Thermotogota bacterium]
ADILLTAGVALFSASIQATLIAPAIILWFLLAPFVEEPYLRKRFGRTYEEYMKKVPRFMGWIRKIR